MLQIGTLLFVSSCWSDLNDGYVSISSPNLNWKSKTLYKDFKAFKAHCNHIFQGPLAEEGQAAKIDYLILWMCTEEEHVVLNTCQASDVDMTDTYFDMFENYIWPVIKFRASGYQFYQQNNGQVSPLTHIICA